MPTIRIDDDVFEGLKSIAVPFSDTPNTVIRRLLEERGELTGRHRVSMQDPDNNSGNPKKRRPASQSIYETFLLYVLWINFHGKANKKEVTDAVIALMKSHRFIIDADLETVSTGETRAENTIAWARNALKDKGLISRLSARGVWELTPDGIEKAKQVVLPTPNF